MSLLVALTAGVTIVMLGIRNWGEPRIWLWALPIISMLAGVGMVQLSRQVARRNDILATALVACGWSGAMCIQMIVAQPVRASTETGVFPEVQEVVEGITERYRIDDIVTGDFVSVEPLRYYLQRWAASHEPPGRSAMERMWVILDSDEQERANNVRARVARAGAPPLSASTPAFTVGNVWVYLLGRSAHAPDDRLLRSVDWLTGVAGRVDDERAGALLSEVMADTDSPRARMWMARCLQLGCMAVEPDPGVAKRLADEAIQGILELAVAGDAEGSFLLGTAYELGLGQAVDSVQATASYRKAAEAGHVLAARLLAEAYFNGKGIGAGDTAAVTWWRRAADAGDATAQLRLGDAYRAGRGVERDLDQAESWYARAAERGLVRVVRF